MKRSRLLAFVHIEKAAGTSLIYLMRQHYLLRYMDVRPLHSASNGTFSAADLRSCLRMNPFLRAIGGHSVRPVSDLESVIPDISYVTLLRQPLQRYVSQYRYWVRVLRKDWTFAQFLDHEPSHNFQTRKLVGSGTVSEAKKILAERFLLVGVAEQFDHFLLELQERLRPEHFDPRYRRRNITPGTESGTVEILDRYDDRIRANNAGDLELYQYVLEELLPRQRATYTGDLDVSVASFRESNGLAAGVGARLLMDAFCRKAYYEPATGLLRRANGMPMKGSY